MVTQYVSYQDVLKLDVMSFISHMEQYKFNIETEISTRDDAKEASKRLGTLSNNYSYISSLLAVAKAAKREYKRDNKKKEYEDMIDKEYIIEITLKSIDVQYKALSKSISLYMDSLKELMYIGG